MAMPKDQRQMEAFIQSEMLEQYTAMPDAVHGLLHARFVRCDYDARMFEAVIQTVPWMRNINGVMHGGVIATALDGMGGQLMRCYVPKGKIAPTCNLSVSYMQPVPLATQLHVRMRAMHTGRRMLFVNGEAFLLDDGAEKLCATSTASYFIVE